MYAFNPQLFKVSIIQTKLFGPLDFELSRFLCIAVFMANSVDPDQMLHSAASDLGLHCLQRPNCPNT